MASAFPLTNDAVDQKIYEYLNKTITEEIYETCGEGQVVIQKKDKTEGKYLTVEEKDKQQTLLKAKLYLEEQKIEYKRRLTQDRSKKRKREEEEKETKRIKIK